VSDAVIALADPAEPSVRALIEALDAYMIPLYPAESNHLLDIETLRRPEMRFFAARVGAETLGCGGCWLHDDYAEIKRVYVNPQARGLGLAKKLMDRIEDEARAAGMTIARLETGIHQPEAIGLYRKLGYALRAAFGDYPADDPNSVFMEKRL
jgi:putative acetyltransferase